MSKDRVFITTEDADSIGVVSVMNIIRKPGTMDFLPRPRYFGLKRKLSTLSDMDLLIYELSEAMGSIRFNIVITNITYFS